MSHSKHGPGFHHIAFKSADFDKTLAFYASGFNINRAYGWGAPGSRAAMLDIGDGNYIEVFETPEKIVPPDGVLLHFALRVPNCDQSYAQAIAAGATKIAEPYDVAIQGDTVVNVRIAFLKGHDGEVVELFQNEVL